MDSETLENRLIEFAQIIISITDQLPDSRAGNHVASQLLRSGTSPAPNYAEARSAESRKDFIHKLKVALKELRESMVWLKMIAKMKEHKIEGIRDATRECNELIAIFVSSAKTMCDFSPRNNNRHS